MDNGYLDQIIEIIQSKSRLLPRGGMTKTGIQNPPDIDTLDMSKISGIREYNPSEYTFTAQAGTRLKEINQMLFDNGQFLPFDPPLAAQGATLGGTVAANLSGCMRYHYGGVRDFILGVHFLDSRGQLVRAGGKVVKNAAGFDIPKLMVGSLGSLGTIVELSFKVFPRPEEYISLVSKYENLVDALAALVKLIHKLSRDPLFGASSTRRLLRCHCSIGWRSRIISSTHLPHTRINPGSELYPG